MRLWLSKNSEVPLREQLEAQIVLGIVSNDLRAGQKLPSIRELARRHKIHANTVSSAYSRLRKSGWVDFRKGSGVFVRRPAVDQPLNGRVELDHLISGFLRSAREKGFSLSSIQARLRHWLELQPPDHFLVIEPDPELRRILAREIEKATGVRASGSGTDDQLSPDLLAGAAPVTLLRQAEKARRILPRNLDPLILHSRSVVESLRGQAAPSAEAIIVTVSHWPEFLRWSRAILVAAGLDARALSFRSPKEKGWRKGIKAAAFVVTDSVTVGELPANCDARVFTILSDSSLEELRQFADRFMHAEAAQTVKDPKQ